MNNTRSNSLTANLAPIFENINNMDNNMDYDTKKEIFDTIYEMSRQTILFCNVINDYYKYEKYLCINIKEEEVKKNIKTSDEFLSSFLQDNFYKKLINIHTKNIISIFMLNFYYLQFDINNNNHVKPEIIVASYILTYLYYYDILLYIYNIVYIKDDIFKIILKLFGSLFYYLFHVSIFDQLNNDNFFQSMNKFYNVNLSGITQQNKVKDVTEKLKQSMKEYIIEEKYSFENHKINLLDFNNNLLLFDYINIYIYDYLTDYEFPINLFNSTIENKEDNTMNSED